MGSRSQWLVRVAVLAVAIAAVSIAFAMVLMSPSLIRAQDYFYGTQCVDDRWAGHTHNTKSNFWGSTGCLTRDKILSLEYKDRALWTDKVTHPHHHGTEDDGHKYDELENDEYLNRSQGETRTWFR